jgi:hypothetical protein
MLELVAVIGAAACTPEQAALAEEVGQLLAERGAAVVCGGRTGVMEAVCRGAQQAGGLTVGLLAGDDPAEANSYVEIAIPTGLGEVRNALVARAGRAVIAIGGGYGTLSEIAFALKSGRPVIGLGSWQATDGLDQPAAIRQASSAAQAVEWALTSDLR